MRTKDLDPGQQRRIRPVPPIIDEFGGRRRHTGICRLTSQPAYSTVRDCDATKSTSWSFATEAAVTHLCSLSVPQSRFHVQKFLASTAGITIDIPACDAIHTDFCPRHRGFSAVAERRTKTASLRRYLSLTPAIASLPPSSAMAAPATGSALQHSSLPDSAFEPQPGFDFDDTQDHDLRSMQDSISSRNVFHGSGPSYQSVDSQ